MANLSIAGYQIEATQSVEVNEDYNLVLGHEIKVSDTEGNPLFEKLRGFMPLKKAFLIREEDGVWYLCSVKGSKKAIKKTNLTIGKDKKKALMFDERGKMHMAQMSPYYTSLNVK